MFIIFTLKKLMIRLKNFDNLTSIFLASHIKISTAKKS